MGKAEKTRRPAGKLMSCLGNLYDMYSAYLQNRIVVS